MARHLLSRAILVSMSRMSDLSGRALDGRYELHALIGEGAFGRVYRGLDRRLARAVAVKVIKPWWAEDSVWVERFQHEAQLLARVSDPGIVQIYDIGHAGEGPYYVAELVDGESLADLLQRGPLQAAHARTVAEQLCHALASAHAQAIVHCDVKPANVLLTADGRVKVGDFGVARLAEGTSQAPSATVAGTPRYMSPEQARGRPTSSSTDVYSAGVVLYEMLAGRPPFVHGSAVELGLRHVQDRPPRLSTDIPLPLRDVVERALAKDPADRYRDGAEMARALRAAGSSQMPVDGGITGSVSRAGAVGASPGTAEGATTVLAEPASIDRSDAPTVVASTAATRIMGAGSGASAPAPPPRRRTSMSARPRRIALLLVLLALGGGTLAVILLSSGPPPVRVPGVVGQPSSSAESLLARTGLRYAAAVVAAPGSDPGVVTNQSPAPAATAPRGSTVKLSIAEAPRWRALTSFSGVDDGRSVPFHILGSKWRVRYSMAYEGSCTLLVVCFGPSAEADNLNTGASFGDFELGQGETETHTFDSGPGLYRLLVSGGHDSAQWSMTVEDDY
jgi:eukaryotic-like serine/threonine-protein kinase